MSENEIDISKALFDNGDSASSGDEPSAVHPDRRAKIVNTTTALDVELDDESDDADFIAATQAASNRKASNIKGRSVKKGGGFQAMGLNSNLLKAITRKGFSVPTPIQRKTIPLVLDGKDVVGMARTGSGKTAAFVVPMIEKLKGHSAKVGARALILSPSRELALQTLKVVKELGKGTGLKCVLLVGGDSLEEQFGFMSGNPDIIIATPGRFLHLKIEMGLDLSSIQHAVFDEADRLFEMGFATQLTEILHALPQSRQTLLFSATLPKSLVEFARAGLQDPSLVRLDAESKVSPDLQNAFFGIKSAEKEGALLHILQDVIKIPTGQTEAAIKAKEAAKANSKKRKRSEFEGVKPRESPTQHSTIIFAATKHHVEYLANLLRLFGFAVSNAYGSLDQTARKMQVQDFRTGMTNIFVVTDVAARGIDIPVLANVINYDFPPQPKIFVHRVGRTARAGQRGWSYSLIKESDAPYLLDLQLFLSKSLVLGSDDTHDVSYTDDIVAGSLVRDQLERHCEWIGKILEEDPDVQALRSVAMKGEKLYLRTRTAASSESAKRSKEITTSKGWVSVHPLFAGESNNALVERDNMLSRISTFRPQETVFEIGRKKGPSEAAEIVKRRRETIESKRRKLQERAAADGENILPVRTAAFDVADDAEDTVSDADTQLPVTTNVDFDSPSESELEVTFSQPTNKQGRHSGSYKDPENFMSYTPNSISLAEERGYGVHSGQSNFMQAAQGVSMDLANDDGAKAFTEPSRARGMRWDKKSKKYVVRANDEDGSKGAKLVRGESGQKLAASFRSGRFDVWRKANKVERLPRVGEQEKEGVGARGMMGQKRWKHKVDKAPKEADKYRDDYYKRKKRVDKAKEDRRGRFGEGKGKGEIRGVEDVRKERRLKEKRKGKNARPSGKKGKA